MNHLVPLPPVAAGTRSPDFMASCLCRSALFGSAGAARGPGFVAEGGKESVMRGMMNRMNETVSGRGVDDPATNQMMRRGIELGVKFRPGSVQGGQLQQIVNSGAERSIQFADIYDDLIQRPNQNLMQRKVLRSLGSDAETFTGTTMGNIRATLSNERTDILKAAPKLGIDAKIIDDLGKVKADYNKNVARLGQDDPIVKQVDNVLESLEGKSVIDAKDYSRMRQQLRGAHKSAIKNDPNQAFALQHTIDALDELFRRQAGEGLADRFHTNTQRFRMLKAVDGPGVVQPNSTISFPSMRRQLDKNFESEFTFNQADEFGSSPEFKELFDTTKVLSHFKGIIGDSGTVPASELRTLISDPVGTAVRTSIRPIVRGIIEEGQPTLDMLQ